MTIQGRGETRASTTRFRGDAEWAPGGPDSVCFDYVYVAKEADEPEDCSGAIQGCRKWSMAAESRANKLIFDVVLL